jgi:hypothetical protein
MSNHSWDVSRSFVMTEKQWLVCFVSWSHELWPENGMNQAELSTALKQETSLLHDKIIHCNINLVSGVRRMLGLNH